MDLIGYKCTRSNGTDFRTGTVNYANALKTGEPLVHPNPELTSEPCGRGFHISPTARQTIQFSDSTFRPYRWFKISYSQKAIIAQDTQKCRLSSLKVIAELTLEDIFDADTIKRIEACEAEIKTWDHFPWFKSKVKISKDIVEKLFLDWRSAISPWSNYSLSKELKIVNSADNNSAYISDVANNISIDVLAVVAVLDIIDIVSADTSASAVAEYHRGRWYFRPSHVFLQCERWKLANMDSPNPWQPLVDMFKLGLCPLGYNFKDEFVVAFKESE